MRQAGRHQRLVEAERQHFSDDQRNIVVMDVSQIPEGIKSWSPVIEKRLEADENTIIGAVVLCAMHFDSIVTPGILEGRVIANARAAVPVEQGLLERIARGLAEAS